MNSSKLNVFGRSVANCAKLLLVCALLLFAGQKTAEARFLSPDTWDPWLQGVDVNRYAYSGNDPINGSDPNGHQFAEDLVDALQYPDQAARDAFHQEQADSIQTRADEFRSNGDTHQAESYQAEADKHRAAIGRTNNELSQDLMRNLAIEGITLGKGKTLGVIGNSAKNAKLADALKRHLDYSSRFGTGGIKQLQNGRIRYYGELEKAKKPGTMAGQRYVHEFDPKTGKTRGWRETVDANGNVRMVRPQRADKTKTHHMFDEDGKFNGKW